MSGLPAQKGLTLELDRSDLVLRFGDGGSGKARIADPFVDLLTIVDRPPQHVYQSLPLDFVRLVHKGEYPGEADDGIGIRVG